MIEHYHWVWYLIGFMICPRITFMVLISTYCPFIPIPLRIGGWIYAILSDIHIKINNKTK